MVVAPIPTNEFIRLQELNSLNILDSHCDARYDCITEFAAAVFNAPICLISFVDIERQWFKSRYGFDETELSRRASLCGHAIFNIKSNSSSHKRFFEVPDARLDNRFFDNPLIQNSPKIRSYIAYVLQSDRGLNLGTICIIDTKRRFFSNKEKYILMLLGSMIENLLYNRYHLTGIEDKFDWCLP